MLLLLIHRQYLMTGPICCFVNDGTAGGMNLMWWFLLLNGCGKTVGDLARLLRNKNRFNSSNSEWSSSFCDEKREVIWILDTIMGERLQNKSTAGCFFECCRKDFTGCGECADKNLYSLLLGTQKILKSSRILIFHWMIWLFMMLLWTRKVKKLIAIYCYRKYHHFLRNQCDIRKRCHVYTALMLQAVG